MIEAHNWTPHKLSHGRMYAVSRQLIDGKRKAIYLHRLVTGAAEHRVKFRNGDTTDCRKKNLILSLPRVPSSPAHSGAIGEAAVCLDLTKHGHECYLPFTGHAPADLVSCKSGFAPIRWQIKSRTGNLHNSISVALNSIHPRKGGYERKPTDLDNIDGYAIFNPALNEVYYVSRDDLADGVGSFSINTNAKKANNTKLHAADLTNPDRVAAQFTAHSK